MRIYSSSLELLQRPAEKPAKGLHLTVGNFDGLHLGHQALLNQAQKCKKQEDGWLGVYSFDPHPQSFFKPQGEHIYLEKRSAWRERLADMGVDVLIEEKFTKDFSTLSAQEFLDRHWGEFLNLKSLTVGVDFRFGEGRKGDLEMLKSWCESKGISLHAIEPVLVDGERVSTSRIKVRLSEGDVQLAAKYLGRPFCLRGVVQRGDQRGRKIGFPTLNLVEESAALLKRGVYLTTMCWNSRTYSGITNVGIRPTVHSVSPVVAETHIVGSFDREIYGEEIEIHFESYVREERKFSDLDELKKQIEIDTRLALARDVR